MTDHPSWGKLGPLTRDQIAALAALPVGAFGDLVRLEADPLWRLAEDRPALYERAIELVEETAEEEGLDLDEVIDDEEGRVRLRDELLDGLADPSLANLRRAYEAIGRRPPEGIATP